MQEACDLFLAANGFSVKDYVAPSFALGILGLRVKRPNTKGRQRDVPLHDIHHVLTGYATDWTGEAEIGAWEIRTGCRFFAAYFLNGSRVLLGLFLSPRRVWRAVSSARGKRNLYHDSLPYDRVMENDCRRAPLPARSPPGGMMEPLDWFHSAFLVSVGFEKRASASES
jgi:hypothetical protein